MMLIKIRCHRCGAFLDYRPRNNKLPKFAEKKCNNCQKKLKIKEQDIVVQDDDDRHIPELLDLKFDKRLPLIRELISFIEEEHLITARLIMNRFRITRYHTYKLLKDLVHYGILQLTEPHNFLDRRHKFYILKDGYQEKLLNVEHSKILPTKMDVHFIKLRLNLIKEPDHLDLNRRLIDARYDPQTYKMRGNWDRTIIRNLRLGSWQSIEINRKSIMLNYKGHVLTPHPKATIRDIERYDIHSAVLFLSSLGLQFENHIQDVSAHFAFIGVTLKPRELQIYNQFWVDGSKGRPELETDKLNSAIELLAFSQAVSKTKRQLFFQFWNRQRKVFFDGLKKWDKSELGLMELKAMFMTLATFRSNYEQILNRLLGG